MNAPAVCIFPPEALPLNGREVSQRLGYPYDPDDAEISAVRERLLAVMTPRCAVRQSGAEISDTVCAFDFASVSSRHLVKNLSGCRRAYFLCVTLGAAVDRLISKLYLTDPRRGFLCDALASAYAEALCDLAQEKALGDTPCRPRFSPGYGDLELTFQPPLLRFLNAETALGVTLTQTNFMKPSKTITAIIGVEEQ